MEGAQEQQWGDGESDDSSTSDDDDVYYAEPDPTLGFQVFVLREGRQGRREWKELRDLGGAALFIGYNSAVFFPAGEVPGLLPDCIYFTDDTVGIISCRNKQEPRDMGAFSMKNKAVTLMPSVDLHSNHWPPPIWVTPSIDIVKVWIIHTSSKCIQYTSEIVFLLTCKNKLFYPI